MYESAIVDECGSVMAWCAMLTDKQKELILAEHPEWRIECICV